MKLIMSLFVSVILASSSSAEVRESETMTVLGCVVTPETLLVFDIDNTLVEPVQTLGSDQWWGYQIQKYLKIGANERQATDQAIKDWLQIQPLTQVRPVVRLTPQIVADLQKRGVRIMGLTARPLEAIDVSRKQLQSVGIDLARTAPVRGSEKVQAAEPAAYTQGVIFVGPRNNKGVVLMDFLRAHQIRPARLIFVDDKSKHTTNMDAAATAAGINHIGIRYGAADARVRSFSAQTAEVQHAFVTRVLSDSSATLLIQSGLLPRIFPRPQNQ